MPRERIRSSIVRLGLALVAAYAAAASAGCQTPVCAIDAELIQCRCADGTYGYQRCINNGSGMATWDPHCDCTIGLTPDGGGSSALDDVTSPAQ